MSGFSKQVEPNCLKMDDLLLGLFVLQPARLSTSVTLNECSPPMALWRFYTVGKSGFAKHVQGTKPWSFPFADLDNVQYRLFDTQSTWACLMVEVTVP